MKPQLDVGGTLREVFEIYRDKAGVLLPVAFWLGLIAAIASALAGEDVALSTIPLVLSIVVMTLYEGMVVGLVRDLQDGRSDPSAGELIRSAVPVLLPLIGAGILLVLALAVGFILLVVPGLVMLAVWAVIAPAIVVERTGVIDAFGRSHDLVRGNGWRVFAVVIASLVITVTAALALGAVAIAVANGPIVRTVFGVLASTFTAPIEALVASVLYFRLLAIERSAPSPQPVAASVLEQPGDGQG